MVFAWMLTMLSIQMFVGLVFIYLSEATYQLTNDVGWRYARFVGYTLVLWSFLALILHVVGQRFLVLVDSIGLLVLSITVTAVTVRVLQDYVDVQARGFLTIQYVVQYIVVILLVTLLFALVTIETLPELFTILYIASPVILLPAIYGMYQAFLSSNTRISLSLLFSVSLLFLGHVLNLYATAFCTQSNATALYGTCEKFMYTFTPLYDLPLLDSLLGWAVTGPVVIFAGILLFGYAHFTFHHYTWLRRHVVSTVRNIGAVIGDAAAQDITVSAGRRLPNVTLHFRDNVLQIYTLSPPTTGLVRNVKQAIIEEFGEFMMPTGLLDFDELLRRLKPNENSEASGLLEYRGYPERVSLLSPIKGWDGGQADMCLHEQLVLWSILLTVFTFAVVWIR